MTQEPGRVAMQEPLAYYLTWTTYGSWLPGDERGWVARPGEFREPDAQRSDAARRLMTEPALALDPEQRRVAEDAVADHCRIRGWRLHVVSGRAQHVHAIVTAPQRDPEAVMDQFKAWCTQRLKELERTRRPADGAIRQNWWTQRGSKRWLNDEKSLEEAIHYVAEEQGAPTPRPPDAPAKDTQA